MTILVIADNEDVANTVPDTRADAVVSCGDLPDEIILRVADRIGCSLILAVRGNHDAGGSFDPRITDLHLRTQTLRGITFGGFCGCRRYKPVGNYLFEEAEVARGLGGFPRVDVFVAHNSPRNIHDRDDEVHVGFAAFMTYIRRAHPAFFLHGHQHQNIETVVGATRIIGTSGHRYLVIPEA